MPPAATVRTCSSVARASLALVVVSCALVLWATPSARAAAGSGLSSTPPVPLGRSTPSHRATTATGHHSSSAAASGAERASRLPVTGYDAGTAALLGVGLMAAGLVLRRLTADGRRG